MVAYDDSTHDVTQRRMKLIKSFCGGPGGGFFKKSPLAAGGKEYINPGSVGCFLYRHQDRFSPAIQLT